MRVTVTKVYLPESKGAPTMRGHGQSDEGATVTFEADRFTMEALYTKVMEDAEQPEVDLEPWQVLGRLYPHCERCRVSVRLDAGTWRTREPNVTDPATCPAGDGGHQVTGWAD